MQSNPIPAAQYLRMSTDQQQSPAGASIPWLEKLTTSALLCTLNEDTKLSLLPNGPAIPFANACLPVTQKLSLPCVRSECSASQRVCRQGNRRRSRRRLLARGSVKHLAASGGAAGCNPRAASLPQPNRHAAIRSVRITLCGETSHKKTSGQLPRHVRRAERYSARALSTLPLELSAQLADIGHQGLDLHLWRAQIRRLQGPPEGGVAGSVHSVTRRTAQLEIAGRVVAGRGWTFSC